MDFLIGFLRGGVGTTGSALDTVASTIAGSTIGTTIDSGIDSIAGSTDTGAEGTSEVEADAGMTGEEG